MFKFERYLLGDTDDTLLIDSSEGNALAVLKMALQAERTLDIISRDLDPAIYNRADFVEAVKNMLLKSKRNRLRILVHEPNTIIKRGHRLVDLALFLTSFIEIRVMGWEHAQYNESLFVADRTGYIYRLNGERYEGKLNFNDKRASRLLIHEFDEIWKQSRSDPNFKRALI